MYSKIILISQTIATIKEPKASEPKWYLNIQYIPDLYKSKLLVVIIPDTCTSFCVCIVREVPGAACNNNHELRTSNDESHKPKKSKNHEIHHISCSLTPNHFFVL